MFVCAGPFYSFEGSREARAISGTTLIDVDLLEGCQFSNQQCSTVDAKVAVLHGGITLGSQGGISMYKQTFTTQAFTGPLSSAAIALSTVQYVSLSDDPGAVRTFNTQTLTTDTTGASVLPTEKISFDVSDQSFTGAIMQSTGNPKSGVAQVFSLTLDMTVVAMNNAPVITAPAKISAKEDVGLDLQGISVSDVDADSLVISTLAQYLWMNMTENQDFLNKIQVTFSVKHGRLYFPSLKGMLVVAASEQSYYIFKSRYPFHDLCRMKNVYTTPSASTSYASTCIINIDKNICPTGKESTCLCTIADTCTETTGTTTLFLNTSRPQFKNYLSALQDSLTVTDLTCGGVPIYSSNVFTTGHLCTSNADCQALQGCSSTAEGCLCCANLNVSCSSHSDCTKVEAGSLCGCTWGGPASARPSTSDIGPGTCGPWIKPPLLAAVRKNPAGLGDLLSNCKAVGTYTGIPCAKNYFTVSQQPSDCPTCVGFPCTYLGAGYRTCIPPVLLTQGTGIASVTDPLSTTGAVSITFYGQLRLVNRVLAQMAYQTNLNYNRLYRIPQCYPPPLELTKACSTASGGNFIGNVDDVEQLSIAVNDLGNSGGIARDIKITNGVMNINVAAVNDRPAISAPLNILAVEDWPFSFLNLERIALAGLSLPTLPFYSSFLEAQCAYNKNRPDKTYDESMGGAVCLCYRTCLDPLKQFGDLGCSCANDDCDVQCAQKLQSMIAAEVAKNIQLSPRRIGEGIFISDPDNTDYGFLNMEFRMNISCKHGRLLLNEAFLQQRDMLSTRIKVLNYQGFGVQSETPSRKGENIGVGLYYQPNEKNAADCEFCPNGWIWMDGKVQCTDTTPFRICPMWGVGNRFIALSGSMADLNLALSNVTYLGDPNFNTRYGVSEAITIVVNDDGAAGDVYNPLQSQMVIEVEVESVNDPPSIGQLVPVLKDQVLNLASMTTINLYSFTMAEINQTEHFVEVDEDTIFVFNHTWLWVNDVDAQEAYLIESLFPGFTRLQANQRRTYSCNAGWDSAGIAALAKLSNDKDPYCNPNTAKTGFNCIGGVKSGCTCISSDDSFTCSSSCTCQVGSCCFCEKPPVCPVVQNGNPVTIS
jgi:hypothetical protein